MNHTLFPDVLINTEGEVGLTSKRANWAITQADQTGEIKITLNDRNCYDAYHMSKYFGLNVDRKFWQFWKPKVSVFAADNRIKDNVHSEW